MHEIDEDTSECSNTKDYIDGTTITACQNVDHIIQHAKTLQELRDKIYENTLPNIQAVKENGVIL